MTDLPYTVLSCAMSLDGYLDDSSGNRLVLSNAADLDRVDEVRARADAILVGAGTVRADNPRLLVRSEHRQARRVAEGRGPSPLKVTVTRHTSFDPSAAFFTTGNCDKLVYCATGSVPGTRDRLRAVATVVDAGSDPSVVAVSEDLATRGVRRLLVEGGQNVHTQFLTLGLADELHVVVAPFFVGDSRAHRVVGDGPFPWNRGRRAQLMEVRRIEDVVLLRYALSDRFAEDESAEVVA
ncbi:RibD family protein [Knoellia sp. Soil729]|uniref:RibD family protein n=1 Tax=Knoellia sp. Soil729 TaxID=1736394 RepID=UPI0007022B08|nr:RibD family protein [Knoellia sp. Soil729]KRE42584.1 deaminase [Knoellia sp. Soil729]